jgi:hypothetical protein
MPVHDWRRVSAGIFHDFHNTWLVELKNALNDGLLPPDFYAISEQYAGPVQPDVLTLKMDRPRSRPPLERGMTAVAAQGQRENDDRRDDKLRAAAADAGHSVP